MPTDLEERNDEYRNDRTLCDVHRFARQRDSDEDRGAQPTDGASLTMRSIWKVRNGGLWSTVGAVIPVGVFGGWSGGGRC